MGKTFAEKVLASKSGQPEVVPGQIVNVAPDVVMSHDNSAFILETFREIGVTRLKDPSRVVMALDHCVPAATERYALNHKMVREFVAEQGIENFYDVEEGVCHQVLPEKGHVLPGSLILGSDSHTTTYGAFGAFAAGIGRSETAAIWATGKMWLRVPETIHIGVTGAFRRGVSAKDVILRVIGDLGADGALYKSVEFSGETIRAMSIAGRMVLCNMAAEMGAKNAYVAPDEKTDNWLRGRVKRSYQPVFPDEDADHELAARYDVAGLEPQVACPHAVDNVVPVSEVEGTRINQALIGTCTNGRMEDLRAAAMILKGRKVARGVRLLVFPASREVYLDALADGTLAVLATSGGIIMNPGCGPCLGAHEGILAPGEVCLSTANRNFKGRMGSPEAKIYLANPETVAASAVAGEICAP